MLFPDQALVVFKYITALPHEILQRYPNCTLAEIAQATMAAREFLMKFYKKHGCGDRMIMDLMEMARESFGASLAKKIRENKNELARQNPIQGVRMNLYGKDHVFSCDDCKDQPQCARTPDTCNFASSCKSFAEGDGYDLPAIQHRDDHIVVNLRAGASDAILDKMIQFQKKSR
jgi:hypothetical protein